MSARGGPTHAGVRKVDSVRIVEPHVSWVNIRESEVRSDLQEKHEGRHVRVRKDRDMCGQRGSAPQGRVKNRTDRKSVV